MHDKRLRISVRRNLYWCLGCKVGYWPCLRGPFVQVTVGPFRIDAWYGLPSNKPAGKAT